LEENNNVTQPKTVVLKFVFKLNEYDPPGWRGRTFSEKDNLESRTCYRLVKRYEQLEAGFPGNLLKIKAFTGW